MYVSRFLIAVAASAALFACGSSSNTLPDGGRDRVVCTEGVPTMTVTVHDANGAAVSGATVTARNTGSGQTVTGTTDSNGVTNAVTKDIGSGTIQLSATSGTKTSQLMQVDWVCGDCSCTATPQTANLVVQ